MRNSPSAMVAPRRRTESSEGRERRKPLPLPMRPGAYGLRVIGYGGYRLWQLLLMLCLLLLLLYIYIYIRALGPVHQLHHVHRSAYLTDTPLSDLIEAEGRH